MSLKPESVMNAKSQTLISINPATLQKVGEVTVSDPHEIQQKVQQARDASKAWKLLGVERRAAILKQCFAAFKKRENEIAELTMQEMGKTITEARGDMTSDFNYFHDFISQGPSYIADEITVNQGNVLTRIVYEPRGVVASIVPWNFPIGNFFWSVMPNLVVGNTVVFKHSEECPLIGKLIDEVMKETDLPPGVFSQVYGDGRVGECLAEQDIDLLWFTGSSAVGRKLYAIAGRKQIKAVLEMGGSNPAVVFDDVKVDELIPKLYSGRFYNCGQVCDAVKRLIVHESIYTEVVDKLAKHVQKIKVGNPELPDTALGPLAAMRQLELLEAQLADSVQQGARIVAGGKRPDGLKGAYFQPTIVTNIKNTMRLWREEIFGPVLPVVSFRTEEEAVALANDTDYGLGAVVHSADLQRARRVASLIEAGSVDINHGSHWHPGNPFGGYKTSGMGCEHGRLGFQELCRFKVVAEG